MEKKSSLTLLPLMWKCVLAFLTALTICVPPSVAGEQQQRAQVSEFQWIGRLSEELNKYAVPPWALLKYPEFKNAYYKALEGKKGIHPWVKNLRIVSTPGISFTDGTAIVFYYQGNQIHEGSNNLTLVFEPATSKVALKLEQDGSTTTGQKSARYLGTPSTFMKQLLDADPAEVLKSVPKEALVEQPSKTRR